MALSGALSAALPTGQFGRDSFLNSLAKGITGRGYAGFHDERGTSLDEPEICPCYCTETHEPAQWPEAELQQCQRSQMHKFLQASGNCCLYSIQCIQRWIQKLVEHKYFQQGILLAILINTLSMGIEYHNQVYIIFI